MLFRSVSEAGDVILNETSSSGGMFRKYIRRLADIEIQKLRERREIYTPFVSAIDPKDRVVLLLDDGIATGSTMRVAIEAVRRQAPKKVIVCTPVASVSAVELLEPLADEVIALDVPHVFMSVGGFYEEFAQVSDQEVAQILSRARPRDQRPEVQFGA